jgi:hypothetical protein
VAYAFFCSFRIEIFWFDDAISAFGR